MKYMISKATTPQMLVDNVNKLVEAGWKPQGGVVVYYKAPSTEVLIQALIKEEVPIKEE